MYGNEIDREVGNMVYDDAKREKDFLYMRYNADMSDEGLEKLGFGHLDPKKIRKMDDPDNIQDLLDIGQAAAKELFDRWRRRLRQQRPFGFRAQDGGDAWRCDGPARRSVPPERRRSVPGA